MTVQDQPEPIARLLRFAGKTRKEVRNPNLTAREAIEVANYIANLQAASRDPQGMAPVARIRYERNTPGRENEMPRVMSCNRMADGVYEVFTAAQVLAMGRVPPGFIAAPVEPTAEMVDAAEEAYMPFGDMALAIQSAIAAAPRPPAAQDVQQDKRDAERWLVEAYEKGRGVPRYLR